MARKLTLALVASLLLALLPAAGAHADAAGRLAHKACVKERKKLGRAAFAHKYGPNPMRACRARTTRDAREALRTAEERCQEQLAELGPEDFGDLWSELDDNSDAMEQCIAITAGNALAPGNSGAGGGGDEPDDDSL